MSKAIRIHAHGGPEVLTYEDAVLPLLSRHGGRLQLRVRAVDQSAELHIISFDSREGQEAFATDPSRLQLMRLLQGRLLRQRVVEVTESAVNYGTADRFSGDLPKGETR